MSATQLVYCAPETNWFFQNEACMLVHPIILALTKQEDGEFQSGLLQTLPQNKPQVLWKPAM